MTETIPVPFNELKPKVAAHRAAIDRAIARVLDRGWFILGPEVDAFEKELAAAMGAKDAVAVGNGTDALILALEVKGIGPGHEVITSPMSAAFSALAISRHARWSCPTAARASPRSASRLRSIHVPPVAVMSSLPV